MAASTARRTALAAASFRSCSASSLPRAAATLALATTTTITLATATFTFTLATSTSGVRAARRRQGHLWRREAAQLRPRPDAVRGGVQPALRRGQGDAALVPNPDLFMKNDPNPTPSPDPDPNPDPKQATQLSYLFMKIDCNSDGQVHTPPTPALTCATTTLAFATTTLATTFTLATAATLARRSPWTSG